MFPAEYRNQAFIAEHGSWNRSKKSGYRLMRAKVEGGKVVGFDVDLMNAIGQKLGLAVEFKSYKFDALITGVQAGSEFDMIASAMTITDERKQSVDFSDPYINSNQSLAVRKVQ
jgi:polar amino acid transport system substrate-binding protein